MSTIILLLAMIFGFLTFGWVGVIFAVILWVAEQYLEARLESNL